MKQASSRTNNCVVSSFTVDVKNQLNSTPLGTATYDNNGNLTELNDGITQYQYTYDDENQLIAAQMTGSWRVEFSYDGLGRLRHRQGYFWTELDPGIYDWLPNAEVYYIYDGRRVIQERSAVNQPTVGYTRGIDLSGTREGSRWNRWVAGAEPRLFQR